MTSPRAAGPRAECIKLTGARDARGLTILDHVEHAPIVSTVTIFSISVTMAEMLEKPEEPLEIPLSSTLESGKAHTMPSLSMVDPRP